MGNAVRNQTIAEAAVALGLSARRIERALAAGAPKDKLGARIVRVNADEVRAWMAEREAARAAGKGAA